MTERDSITRERSQYSAESVTLAIATMDRFKSTIETLLQLNLKNFYDVIIIDDSNENTLREWCTDRSIRYYKGPNKNLQAARNLAITKCESEIISFVDDDVLLPNNFAERVATAFNSHPKAVAIGGPTLSPAVKSARDLCYKEKMSVNTRTGTVHDDSYRWIPENSTQVDLLKGANMSFLHTPLKSIGGFDTSYGGPAQREETDVVVRLKRHGEVICDPSLRCLHKQTGGADFSPPILKWRFRNHGYFVRKNFGNLSLLFGFISIFLRLCGNPDSVAQLIYRKMILKQQFSIISCLLAYIQGGIWGQSQN
ncbi:glycosyltransferase family 2 protein [Halorubrum sp. T3]|uniref:glycosyltransferase family 2 protein n=1 Tax=Halorubrum sp. T3 TaxID=1194088 RepID=UPI0009E65BA5|nr:glycosyltransferase family 2 protein [Halorubrum sp. T3]